MGRILFIRVCAETYDEKDVPKTWPMTFALIWPEPMLDAADAPAKVAAKLTPGRKRGVLELLDAFVEHVRFADLPSAKKSALQGHANRLEALRQQLDAALGNRDAGKAHALTNDIEDALDETEKAVRECA
ncbi:hypothetical protein LJB82_00900 [Desulfovibrio sp. OttesenSCG-928-M16]|nr:hypothetical protein [Desulfovibrio sp. OttesenSCG-928-M16]